MFFGFFLFHDKKSSYFSNWLIFVPKISKQQIYQDPVNKIQRKNQANRNVFTEAGQMCVITIQQKKKKQQHMMAVARTST